MKTSSTSSFERIAVQAFRFLVVEFGFALHVSPHENAITFTNDTLSLRVWQEPLSYMIYVDLLRIDTGEQYVLHEVLHALSPEDERLAQCSGSDENKMAHCLAQIAKVCRQHLPPVFALDHDTLNNIAKSARSTRRQYTLESELGLFRDDANVAWDRREWARARELYEKARLILSSSELRRLNFLKKKAGE